MENDKDKFRSPHVLHRLGQIIVGIDNVNMASGSYGQNISIKQVQVTTY
jgi:hypothetical protein